MESLRVKSPNVDTIVHKVQKFTNVIVNVVNVGRLVETDYQGDLCD